MTAKILMTLVLLIFSARANPSRAPAYSELFLIRKSSLVHILKYERNAKIFTVAENSMPEVGPLQVLARDLAASLGKKERDLTSQPETFIDGYFRVEKDLPVLDLP